MIILGRVWTASLKASSSLYTMFFLMVTLAVGAAWGTFVENDFGTETARDLVYNAFWYELCLTCTIINMMLVLWNRKTYKRKLIFCFHFAFVIILVGAGLTRYTGFEGMISLKKMEQNREVSINDQTHLLPFSIELLEFVVTHYPGSASPSEFTANISLSEPNGANIENIDLGLNRPYDFRGHRIFLNTYDRSKEGISLTINKDPGKDLTYLGYGLLFLGLILNLFHRHSRFRILLRQIHQSTTILLLISIIGYGELRSETPRSPYVQNYLTEHAENSKGLALKWGSMVVQSRMGRSKPLNTLNLEILRKLSGTTSFQGCSADQVTLGMLSRPEIWKTLDLIKVKTASLKEKIGVPEAQERVSFRHFFDEQDGYLIKTDVEKASARSAMERTTYDKDLLAADEKLSIFLMVTKGTLLRIFPIPNDPQQRWEGFTSIWDALESSEAQSLERPVHSFIEHIFSRDYHSAKSSLEEMRTYQVKHGIAIYPSPQKIDIELLYNRLAPFPIIMICHLILGVVLLMVAFFTLVFPHWPKRIFYQVLWGISVIFLLAFLIAMIMRTYISGHAPMSDTYESLLYISFSSCLAGLIFLKKSLFVQSSSFLMSGIFLFIAHLGQIDPEITNLVPVLKSFWLSVHVSVITASYGFLGISCLLGLFTLVLYVGMTFKEDLRASIRSLIMVNEAYMIFGLTLLIIGNFLGAIWANESWGRYWGWDPKETWAYISIILYAMILHLRLIKKIYSELLFSICSILGFYSILMTYFGVNFYLSGKHSYAKGTPLLLPNEVLTSLAMVVLLIMLAIMSKFYRSKRVRH